MSRIAVVALGGNAITRAGQQGTFAEQWANATAMVRAVCRLREGGWTVVLVHGNGPQVGNLAVQQEEAARRVPELPMFSLNAMTEGQLGSLIVLALRQECGPAAPGAVAVVTHVEVDRHDPAFTHPTKPIGPFLSEQEARRQAAERGWVVGEDAGRGYRRMVASPRPVRIVELEAVRALVEQGVMVIAAGGGGVPVIAAGAAYQGVDAVIDKDLAAQRLASSLRADALALVTDIPQVMLDYGTDHARAIGEMTVEQALGHEHDGQFPAGSMGPKMRAAIQFIGEGGRVAAITDATRLCATLGAGPGAEPVAGQMGTRIVAAEQSLGACG